MDLERQTVFQILTTAKPSLVVEKHNELYPNSETSLEEYSEKFLNTIRLHSIIYTETDVLEINHWRTETGNLATDDERIEVSRITDGVAASVALSPWSYILGCRVICNIPREVSLEEKAAHIYQEMTFYGIEEDVISVNDEVEDVLELIDRNGAQKTTSSLSVFAHLFPENSAEENAKMEQEAYDKVKDRIRNEKLFVVRTHKNGVLQDPPVVPTQN